MGETSWKNAVREGTISTMANFEVLWEAPEFEYREKGISWYWISIIVAALLVAFSVATRNFLFGLFVVLAELLLIFWANRSPEILSFGVSDQGLSIQGRRLYAISEFGSWSADISGDEWVVLHFQFNSRLRPPLTTLVPKEKLEPIRTNLKTVLKEIEYEASLFDNIEKFLGF